MDQSRRQFLFGGLKKAKKITQSAIKKPEPKVLEKPFYLRPPGAIEESQFNEKCENNCMACLTACPTYVIQKVRTPDIPEFHTAYIDPRISGCSYCHDFPCIQACPTGALIVPGKPMGVAKVLSSCITMQNEFCEICFHTCPEAHQALYKSSKGELKVNEADCVGCGSCASACFLTPKAIVIKPLEPEDSEV